MLLVIGFQPFQDFQSFLFGRLLYCHRLETSLKCCILLDIFPVFFQGCSSDQLDLSSGKRRFQNIGCIQSTFCATCTNDGMKLIDKEQYFSVRPYFIYNLADTFFKLTSVLAACYHSGHIQYHYPFTTHSLRHQSQNNLLRQSLYNSGLSNTWFSYQTWIILSSSAEDLNQPGNFSVTSYYRIQFAICCHGSQIPAVLIQRRCGSSTGSLFISGLCQCF